MLRSCSYTTMPKHRFVTQIRTFATLIVVSMTLACQQDWPPNAQQFESHYWQNQDYFVELSEILDEVEFVTLSFGPVQNVLHFESEDSSRQLVVDVSGDTRNTRIRELMERLETHVVFKSEDSIFFDRRTQSIGGHSYFVRYVYGSADDVLQNCDSFADATESDSCVIPLNDDWRITYRWIRERTG